MPITPSQFQEMVDRVKRNQGRDNQIPDESREAIDKAMPGYLAEQRETDLHKRIIWWCDSQFPFVPYIHARTDKRSTIAVGCPDFCVLYKSQCLLIECKSRTGKMSIEQLAWMRRVNEQGFAVHTVRDFKYFLKLIESVGK